MSRGPGRWQRLILDSLETGAPVVITHPDFSTSEQVAIRRAAYRLEEEGRIRLTSERVAGRPRLVAYPLEGEMPEPLNVTGMDGKVYRMPGMVEAQFMAKVSQLNEGQFEDALRKAREAEDMSYAGVLRAAGLE